MVEQKGETSDKPELNYENLNEGLPVEATVESQISIAPTKTEGKRTRKVVKVNIVRLPSGGVEAVNPDGVLSTYEAGKVLSTEQQRAAKKGINRRKQRTRRNFKD